MSEHVDWRFDDYRRRSSGLVLSGLASPDVRRWCSRRGSKHQAKAQGRPFPSGGYRREADRTGEALEPLADVSLRSALPVGRWSGAQGLAAEKRQAPAEERAQSGRAPSSSGHRRHPPRSQLVHAKRGNPRRGPALAGKPTVRKAQSLGGNLMTEKRRPAAERQRETGFFHDHGRGERTRGRDPRLAPG